MYHDTEINTEINKGRDNHLPDDGAILNRAILNLICITEVSGDSHFMYPKPLLLNEQLLDKIWLNDILFCYWYSSDVYLEFSHIELTLKFRCKGC